MSLLRKIFRRLQDGTLRDIGKETYWIYHHTRSYRKAIFLYTLLGLASTLLSIVTSLLSRNLINAIIAREGWQVLQTGIAVVLLAVAGILLSAFVSRYSAKINLRISIELHAEVYSVFMNTDWSSLQQYHSGDLLSRINTDVATVASSVLGWVPTLIIKLTQFIVSLVVILYYDPTMAVFALLSAPLTFFVARPFISKMRSLNKEMRNVNSELISFYEETLQNIQAIKAFNLVDSFRKKLDEVQKKYYDTSMEFNRFSVKNSSFLSATSKLVSFLCLGWGAYRLWCGKIDFGTMVLFIQLAGYLASSMTALIKLVPSAIECTVAAQRIMTIFDLPRERMDYLEEVSRLRNDPFSVHLENLGFGYRADRPVLKSLNLHIRPKEMVAIIGPSGSGKTTLFRILLGLLQPTEGSAVLIGPEECVPLSPSTRCLFSYVPQDNVIFSGTIADTLRLVRPDATDDQIYDALRVACAEDFVRKLPDGIYSSLKERGSSLSVGQNQRLAIARAILADAPILLLDEVTSALDLETEQKVLQNIAALEGKTCIISTHRPSVLSLCNHIYRIKDQKLETLDTLPTAKITKLISKKEL